MAKQQQAGVWRAGALRPASIGVAFILLTACSGIPLRAKNGATHGVVSDWSDTVSRMRM
jgi:hypothetical protein